MSYERDRDHATRGLGAIAAVDKVAPPSRARALVMARASRRRDQQVMRMGMGGATLRNPRPEDGPKTSTATSERITRDHRTADRNAPPPPGSPPPAAAPYTPPPRAAVPAPAPVVIPPLPLPPVTTPSTTTPPATPTPATPTPATPTTSPATTKTIVVTAGGGGSGVSMGAKGPGLVLTAPPISIPGLPDLTPTTTVDHTMRNVAIVGGAALAAYLLFFRGNQ